MQFLIHEIKFTPSVPHFNRTDWYHWSGNLREKKTYKHSAQQLEPKNAKRFKKFFLYRKGVILHSLLTQKGKRPKRFMEIKDDVKAGAV